MNSKKQIRRAKKNMNLVLQCLKYLDRDLDDSWYKLDERHQREIESYGLPDFHGHYNVDDDEDDEDDDDDESDNVVFTLTNPDLDKKKLWNIFKNRYRQEILDAQDNDGITASLKYMNVYMENIIYSLQVHCSNILLHFQQFCKAYASLEDRMNILRFYGLFNCFRSISNELQSIDALSTESECKQILSLKVQLYRPIRSITICSTATNQNSDCKNS